MKTIIKVLTTFGILILVLLFAPGIPPHGKYEPITLEPPLPLEGVLAPNSILDKAEELILDREIKGPESIAFKGDELYTGIVGGELIQIKNGKVKTIAKIGKHCEGEWDVKNCGRIAGVRLASDGKIIVADAAYGIYKIDADAGKVETLVSINQPIEGKLPMFPDDLDIDKDGMIYWSDASTIADVESLLFEFLAGPSGRLVKYDTKTKESTVLLNDLHFPNGIQLSENHDFVLVAEMARARVIRYYLKGAKKGQSDIFVDRLPGLPDNIRPNGRGGYYIVLSGPRIPSEISLIDEIGPYPLVRRFLARIVYILVSSLQFLESLYPGPVLREWTSYMKHLGPIIELETLPYKTIIVETDGTGKIIGSLQNEKGPVKGLSEMTIGGQYAYFGSPAQSKFYRLKLDQIR